MPMAPITRPVAAPRRIRFDNRATAGSMAMEANQAISTVNSTAPPSRITNPTKVANAKTSTTMVVTRATVRADGADARDPPVPLPSSVGWVVLIGSSSVLAVPRCRPPPGSSG